MKGLRGGLCVVMLVAFAGVKLLHAQTDLKAPNDAPDPLSIGKGALQHGDFAAARKFFVEYVAANPGDAEAKNLLASTDLQWEHFADAIAECKAVIALKPEEWGAHRGLAYAYARTGDWADFDAERAVLKAARQRGAPGIQVAGFDVIDKLKVGDKEYEVRVFDSLYGHFHTRYVFLHFGADGRPTDYLACESDDSDQSFFQQSHPKEAAAGERSFSLDTYSFGPGGTSQGLIKFYSDGEPTYETVRADVLKVLTTKTAPAATMTVPGKK